MTIFFIFLQFDTVFIQFNFIEKELCCTMLIFIKIESNCYSIEISTIDKFVPQERSVVNSILRF